MKNMAEGIQERRGEHLWRSEEREEEEKEGRERSDGLKGLTVRPTIVVTVVLWGSLNRTRSDSDKGEKKGRGLQNKGWMDEGRPKVQYEALAWNRS